MSTIQQDLKSNFSLNEAIIVTLWLRIVHSRVPKLMSMFGATHSKWCMLLKEEDL